MRSPTTSLPAIALLLASALPLASACPPAGPSGAVDAGAGAGPPTSAAATGPQRPPHPNMATAAWGQRVLEQRVGALPPLSAANASPTKVTTTEVLDALHEVTPASTVRAAELAAAAYRTGTTDAERGNAIALLAAALVLDPTVEGYKERITDAHGLGAYAGTIDASDAIGQSARALVAGAAGSLAQAKRLLEVVATTPGLGSEPRLFLALARRLTGDFGDSMLADLRAALAEAWLDLGLYPEAAATAQMPGGAAQPWLDAVRGRALVLAGNVDDGTALLKAAEPKLDEGNRGDALYWLGRSLTQSPTVAVAEIEAIAATLAARPGFDKESAVLQALLAQKAGDYQKARALLEPIVRGRPVLPVDGDATWLLVDACAGMGDLRCVDEVGARGRAIDGDVGRYQLARAAAVLIGKAVAPTADAGPGDAADADRGAAGALVPLREAHRASPFDEKLAAKVGDAVVAGGPAAASRVRAARKALLRNASKIVDEALAPLAKTSSCRLCRALDAAAASGVDAAKKAHGAIAGDGPPLALADLVVAINDLGAAPVKEAEQALALLDKDERAEVQQAIARARADHKDPDGRRRRDADEVKATTPSPPSAAHAPHAPPSAPGAP